jgi:RNase P subunit RPR2
MDIYCVKCKAKTDTRNLAEVTMKNGRAAVQGVCVSCGTKKFRSGKIPAEV